MPKKFALAKKKAALEEKKKKAAEEKAEREALEAAGVKVKKKTVNKFAYPTPEPLAPPKPLTVAEAMAQAESWNTSNVIANKFSVGTTTTADFEERTAVF